MQFLVRLRTNILIFQIAANILEIPDGKLLLFDTGGLNNLFRRINFSILVLY